MMGAFLWLAVAFLLFVGGFCWLLSIGLATDTLEYDMAFLWENYPKHIREKILKTFE